MTALYVGEERGVPVIMENANPADWPTYREATDDEYARYLAYWTGTCSRCGHERGDCGDCGKDSA